MKRKIILGLMTFTCCAAILGECKVVKGFPGTTLWSMKASVCGGYFCLEFPETTYLQAEEIEDESTCCYENYAEAENENAAYMEQLRKDQEAKAEESPQEPAIAEEVLGIVPDISDFYQVDKTTVFLDQLADRDKLLGTDLKIDESVNGPSILIYHTHSQEEYADSVSGDSSTTVVGVGEYLAQILRDEYGYNVLHHTGEYDVGDRDHAYSNAAPEIEQIIKDNPSIQLVIDLHRDGVADTTRLATEIDGRPTAKIMFFNGLSRTAERGEISSLPNPYLETNLALSFQLQEKAYQYYPDLTRRIYLKGYRYNMHLCPKSMLVEVGAQTNTVEEAKNAMIPLADLINKVVR